MPKDNTLKKILVIGAGPIIIGQACEFDYSGTQACKALIEEGYKVILINSNPATIMTDPEISDATYIEPITPDAIKKIIKYEKPDAILPTMGGQTALNTTLELYESGILDLYNVKLIGASYWSIKKAEDRELFKSIINDLGLKLPKSRIAANINEAIDALNYIKLPCVIRSFFSLGGSGGGIVYSEEEFRNLCNQNFSTNANQKIMIDESIIGWKEFELEVMRDKADNCIVVCTIENINPAGVHTGDSITVAPSQTLTDKEYHMMRDAAFKIIREIGIDTGGANVQFVINPDNGEMLVIEINPRVSRSSALASKATGFPIAKVAAKLAVGYTLDELRNQITNSVIPCSFEPTIDYVVTKIPRFNFDKFPNSSSKLDIQMRSIGEAMAIGRNFQESLQKALQSLDSGCRGLEFHAEIGNSLDIENLQSVLNYLEYPRPNTLATIAQAIRLDCPLEDLYNITKFDKWFLRQIEQIINSEKILKKFDLSTIDKDLMYSLKRKGFSDYMIGAIIGSSELKVMSHRHKLNVFPVYKRVDSCAAEFETSTAYLYSSYDYQCESTPTHRKKVVILGSGPNRIGQGLEFDFCCTNAALALKNYGYEVIMVNSNPETVSTDYDISDRLYFEPITLEHVLEIVRVEKPLGIFIQFGGQVPLKLAEGLSAAGVKLFGSPVESIKISEDRILFQEFIKKIGIPGFNSEVLKDTQKVIKNTKIEYPIIVRPSYVLGGSNMKIIYNDEELNKYYADINISISNKVQSKVQKQEILIEKFIENAVELDVDCIFDGEDIFVGGIMEQLELAGIHSGDSTCSLPGFSLKKEIKDKVIEYCKKMAKSLSVKGFMNVQFVVSNDEVFVVEINLRASRTVPFVSKAIRIPMSKIAALCLVGVSLKDQGIKNEYSEPNWFSIKMPIFPFNKFSSHEDCFLGPQMKSTGEVMGIDYDIHQAFKKAYIAAGFRLSKNSRVLVLSCNDDYKEKLMHLISKKYHNISISNMMGKNFTKNHKYNVIDFREDLIHKKILSNEFDIIVDIPNIKKQPNKVRPIFKMSYDMKVLYINSIRIAEVFFCIDIDKDYNIQSIQDYSKSLS